MVGTGRFELPAPRTPNWQDRPIFVETFTCEVHDEVTPEGRSNADIMMAGREGLFTPHGRLAQLVRAPALQAGSRGFESLTAHQEPVLCRPRPSGLLSKHPIKSTILGPIPSNPVVWKPCFLGAISGVLATAVWWYLRRKPLIPNIHAGFHSFALWWYSTEGSIDGRDSYSR